MKKEWTPEEKVKLLERLVKTIFQAEGILYRGDRDYAMVELIGPDIEEIIHNIDQLEFEGIDVMIQTESYKLDEDDEYYEFQKYIHGSEHGARHVVTFFMNPCYWRENVDLKKEVKDLKEEILGMRSVTTDIMNECIIEGPGGSDDHELGV